MLPLNQKPYWDLERARVRETREVPVEVIVNGRRSRRRPSSPTATPRDIDVRREARPQQLGRAAHPHSSHTNPVFVLVGGKPIRASRDSAEWCLKAVDQCWCQKAPKISERERPEAEKAYEHARSDLSPHSVRDTAEPMRRGTGGAALAVNRPT